MILLASNNFGLLFRGHLFALITTCYDVHVTAEFSHVNFESNLQLWNNFEIFLQILCCQNSMNLQKVYEDNIYKQCSWLYKKLQRIRVTRAGKHCQLLSIVSWSIIPILGNYTFLPIHYINITEVNISRKKEKPKR